MAYWFDNANAPAKGTDLCSAEEIATGKVKEFRFGADSAYAFRMFIFNDQGEYRAFWNNCPHNDVPLNYKADQVFSPDGRYFSCMTHGALFETRQGMCVKGPCEGQGLQKIPLASSGNRLLVGSEVS